jgi:hypothetical protein
MELRDGLWQVGPAGQVDFTVGDDGLVLHAVEAAEGWRPLIEHDRPDRIEVEFARGAEEWELEAEYDDGVLTLTLEQEVRPARAGRFEVGDAGTVVIARSGDRLDLVDARAHPGWVMEIDEQGPDEVEVEFSQGAVEWDFEAEVKRGELEVEIEGEVRGRFPSG